MTSHGRQEGAIMKHAVNLPLEDEQAVDPIRWLAACLIAM
jgi:hypothetical protein